MNRKKILYIITSLLVLMMSWEMEKSMNVAAANLVTIPDEAIRLRILANSDSPEDQWLKRNIRDKVNAEITEWVVELDTIEQARNVIRANLSIIEEIVQEELTGLGKTETFTVQLDEVQFPTKLYGNVVYPAGMYESLLITIGSGQGENWWCVLFPPLCFIDFAKGDAVASDIEGAEQQEDVEVRFFILDLLSSVKNKVKSLF